MVFARKMNSSTLAKIELSLYNDFTEVLIAAGRARQHHQQCEEQHKETDHRSGSGGLKRAVGRRRANSN